MTIAICCPTTEGVVLGADSATTVQPNLPSPSIEVAIRHFNHAQKIFEVGDNGTYGPLMVATWGLGAFGRYSHRSLIADFAQELKKDENAAKSVEEAANLWNDMIWTKFSSELKPSIDRANALNLKVLTAQEETERSTLELNQARTVAEETRLQELVAKKRNDAEQREFNSLQNLLSGGYFLSGRKSESTETSSFTIEFDWRGKKPIVPIPIGSVEIKGVNMFVLRLIKGIDPVLFDRLANDPRWGGTTNDLLSMVNEHSCYHGYDLPLRDAVEMVYSFIYCTIKALRFSKYAPICGGPIEIATITTDRPFRWVSHKSLDVAVHQALFNETRHV